MRFSPGIEHEKMGNDMEGGELLFARAAKGRASLHE